MSGIMGGMLMFAAMKKIALFSFIRCARKNPIISWYPQTGKNTHEDSKRDGKRDDVPGGIAPYNIFTQNLLQAFPRNFKKINLGLK